MDEPKSKAGLGRSHYLFAGSWGYGGDDGSSYQKKADKR